MTARLAKQVMATHAGGLTPSERTMLRHLAVLAGPDGTVRWALSDMQLQRDLGLSRTSVKAARRALVDEHLVEVAEPGVGRHATVYRVLVGISSGQMAAAVGSERSDPQRVGFRPSEGRDSTLSSPVAPLVRARTVSTTYGLYEVPPDPAPTARPFPPAAPGRVEDRAIDEFAVALPEQLLPRSGYDRTRMCNAVTPLLAAGWEPTELATAVVRVATLPAAVISGVGLLEARLRAVARERPRAPAVPAAPWCGRCERADHRWVEVVDGSWVKCPRCHPGARAGADGPPF